MTPRPTRVRPPRRGAPLARRAGLLAGLLLAGAPAVAAAAGTLAAAGGDAPAAADPTLWPEAERAFFADGPGLLLGAADRAELLAADEAGRRRFIADFLARDPDLADAIERRGRLAAAEIDTPLDARFRLLFLRGRPLGRAPLECGTVFRPLEIWSYPRPAAEPAQAAEAPPVRAVVYQPAPGAAWKLWLPPDGKRVLYTAEMIYWLEQWEELQGRGLQAVRFDLQLCKEGRRVDEATGVRGLTDVQPGGVGPVDPRSLLTPPADLARWARTAAAEPEPPSAPTAPALPVTWRAVQFPAAHGQRIVTRALLELPADSGAGVATDGEAPELRLRVEGLVEQEGEVFDRFTVRFKPPPPAAGVPLALAVDRALRPGVAVVLRLRVEDEVGGGRADLARGFAVPAAPRPVAEPPVPDEVLVALDEELGRRRLPGRDSLVLVPPASDVVMGLWRADALVTGERIAKVVFLVDGRPQLSRTGPPWSAEVRLAALPTQQVVRVEGYDPGGELVAVDEVVANQPQGAFVVRIVAPRRGDRVTGETTVRAEVVVPEDRRVDHVEVRLDDKLVATLDRPPWEARVEVPTGGALSYLAVAAYLDDGSRAEDVRFLNSPQFLEEVDVNLVELYTAVADRTGRLVRDLDAEDFTVLEDGRAQTLTKFELVENLPLTVGVAVDVSGSMDRSLPEAKRAAVAFLDHVVRRGDRSFAVSFADRAVLLAPPTGDTREVSDLVGGLEAGGSTALHDALVTALYYFRGVRGQRALVLLSDGDDTSSTTPYRDALEYARRSGVAIYTVGLAGQLKGPVRGKLTELAEETGGRAFFIDRAEELDGVYGAIEEELRSRYLLAYNSDRPPDAAGTFRKIEVKVRGRGLKARTIRGYYP